MSGGFGGDHEITNFRGIKLDGNVWYFSRFPSYSALLGVVV